MKFTFAGIIAAVAVSSIPLLPSFGLINGASISKLALLTLTTTILLLIWSLSLFRRREVAVKTNWISLSLVGVLIAHLLASVFGVYPEHSLIGNSARSTSFLFITEIAVLAFALGHLLSKDDWSLVRRAVVTSAGFFAALLIIGIAGIGLKFTVLWFDLGTRGITLGNETIAAMYLLLAVIFGAIEFVRTKDVRWRWGIGLMTSLVAVTPVMINTGMLLGRVSVEQVLSSPQIILGMTRATSIVFVGLVGFFATWWLVSKVKTDHVRKSLKAVIAILAIAGALVGSLLHLVPGGVIQEKLADSTTMPRYIVWDLTYGAISERPLSGWGPENYDRAFEANFRSDLYTTGGRIEGWFDRAHNVFLDTLATTGILGVLAYFVLVAACVQIIIRARREGTIGEGEQVILLALIVAHLLQLQTAFDTVTTYILLAFLCGYLLHFSSGKTLDLSIKQGKLAAGILVLLAVSYAAFYLGYELPRQASITASLSETQSDRRGKAIEFAVSRTADFEGLHTASSYFVSGVLERGSDQKVAAQARPFLAQYLEAYERYLSAQPNHYRARVNYAYLLLLDTQWGGDRATEAAEIVKASYELSPGNPVTYVLDVMAHAYLGDYTGAERVLEKLTAELPEAQLTKDTASWLAKQKALAPQHSFLSIGNL